MPTDKPKRGGRPTKLNEQVIAEICRFIEAGNWFEVSCRLAGINEETGNVWLKLGRTGQQQGKNKPQPIHKQFAEAVQTAVDRREAALAMQIRKSAQGGTKTHVATKTVTKPDGTKVEERVESLQPPDWRAAAWILERTAPDRWGKQRLEVTGADGGPVKIQNQPVNLSGLTDAEIETLIAAAERLARPGETEGGAGQEAP